jgi:hypothetical protein
MRVLRAEWVRFNFIGRTELLRIESNKLKAALSHAADGDIRYYLNCVVVEITSTSDVAIVSTDGRRAFVGHIPAAQVKWTQAPILGPVEILIPRDVIKSAISQKGELELKATIDGSYQLGNVLFKSIDGKFPDWRRIVPATAPRPLEHADFNWDYVKTAKDALLAWDGRRSLGIARLVGYEESTAATVTTSCGTAFSVVMSMRPAKDEVIATPFHLPR